MSLMSKQNKKKIIILACICSMLILIYETIHIYAIFYSEVTGNVQLRNGTWNIVINGKEISNGVEKNFEINNVNIKGNEHVKPGKLAPSLSGDFELLIIPQNTDVSVKYDISLNTENMKNSSLKIKSIEEKEYNNELIQTGENTYTAIIPLEKIKQGKKNRIKIEVEWENIETNNDEDTEEGKVYQSKLKIPIKFVASQYLGEAIIPYEQN